MPVIRWPLEVREAALEVRRLDALARAWEREVERAEGEELGVARHRLARAREARQAAVNELGRTVLRLVLPPLPGEVV